MDHPILYSGRMRLGYFLTLFFAFPDVVLSVVTRALHIMANGRIWFFDGQNHLPPGFAGAKPFADLLQRRDRSWRTAMCPAATPARVAL
jgi:hypothetical protein